MQSINALGGHPSPLPCPLPTAPIGQLRVMNEGVQCTSIFRSLFIWFRFDFPLSLSLVVGRPRHFHFTSINQLKVEANIRNHILALCGSFCYFCDSKCKL